MQPAATPSGGAQSGFIQDLVGPSFKDLRPGKPETTSTFPGYPNLADLMATRRLDHPDPAVAQVLATAAGYAYSDAGTLAMMMTRMGLENSLSRQVSRSVDAMLINSTAHLVQSQDGRVVILAFRGTPPLDLVSWFLDADVYPETIALAAGDQAVKPYEVHAGFYRNVRITRHEIISALLAALEGGSILTSTTDPSLQHLSGGSGAESAAHSMKPMEALFVTGHSLGGAMAAIFATMLVMSDNHSYRQLAERLKAVYTFGQPMPGSPAFADAASAEFVQAGVPVLRYVYRKDPVPLLPPGSVGEYAHFGQEYRLVGDGTWVPSTSSGQMPWAAGVMTSFLSYGFAKFPVLRDAPFRYKIEDHFPHHYVSALTPPGHTDEFGDYYPSHPLTPDWREGQEP